MPQELPRSTANVLNGLAFEARKTDIDILKQHLVVRNPRFLKSSIQVQKARPGRIEQQIALVGSVKRERFTGWAEQEHGTPMKRGRITTPKSRGGNRSGIVKQSARLRQGRAFIRPEKFQGRSLQQRFQFMMRVLGSRQGSSMSAQNYFLLSQPVPTKRGRLNRGLYVLVGHRIVRLQGFDTAKRVQRAPWNDMMIERLHKGKYIRHLWGKQLDHLIKKGYDI